MFYIYILKSRLDSKFYTGFSVNLRKRLIEHKKGNVESTRDRRPLDLIYYEAYKDKEKENALKEKIF